MSEEEALKFREIMRKGLDASLEKLLSEKERMGEKVVTLDEKGKPITITVEEARKILEKSKDA